MRTIWQRIARNQVTKWRARECSRLDTLNKRGGLMMLLGPRGDVIPAQPIIDGDIWTHAPAFLRKDSTIRGALVECWGRLLRVKIGKPKQEIGEAVAGRLITTTEE